MFLRPDPVWNLCKPLTPMFTTFILHVDESLGVSRDQIVSNKSDLRQCFSLFLCYFQGNNHYGL